MHFNIKRSLLPWVCALVTPCKSHFSWFSFWLYCPLFFDHAFLSIYANWIFEFVFKMYIFVRLLFFLKKYAISNFVSNFTNIQIAQYFLVIVWIRCGSSFVPDSNSLLFLDVILPFLHKISNEIYLRHVTFVYFILKALI